MGEKVRNPQTALAASPEGPLAFPKQSHAVEKYLWLVLSGQGLAMEPVEFRFVVETVHLAQPAHQADVDSPLRPRGGMG
jgi:hypothetical protein